MNRQLLIFDIWGDYAHFKKIYATTSAISYAIPPKTSLYGYMGAILGLPKADNAYLNTFANKQCLLGLSVLNPIVMKRLGANLRSTLKRVDDSPKPSLVEYVYKPRYRLFVWHQDEAVRQALKKAIKAHSCVYSPSLGLAGLPSNFEWVGEAVTKAQRSSEALPVHSVIPRKYLLSLEETALLEGQNELIEQSLFAIEMNTDREVTERDDILLDRKGRAIRARVTEYYLVKEANVVLF
ncbi:CRISPR-associated protein Cas5 [Spirosoma panaciterrae]|uniref:CRISPR-associated protein Cas5 n=1 Tax=Spirosoma panaciterrae TaxID=496058 RepID=UPI000377F952|nr:CRISPR-associated protein Cas5 [Spirosoma panaciterrae]